MARSLALTVEHRQFFFGNGYLTIENVLAPSLCAKVYTDLVASWRARGGGLNALGELKSSAAGRDMWRQCSSWKVPLIRGVLGECIAQMWSLTPIRLLYDQLLPPPCALGDPHQPYRTFRLDAISSFTEVLGGYLMCVQAKSPESTRLSVGLPKTHHRHQAHMHVKCSAGTGVFIGPETEVNLIGENSREDFATSMWILAVVGKLGARYAPCHNDPVRQGLMDLEYASGDALRLETHPSLR